MISRKKTVSLASIFIPFIMVTGSALDVTVVRYESYCRTIENKLPELAKSDLEILIAENNVSRESKTDEFKLDAQTGYFRQGNRFSYATTGTYNRNLNPLDPQPYNADADIRTTIDGFDLDTGVSRTFSGTGTRVNAGVRFTYADTRGTLRSTNNMDLAFEVPPGGYTYTLPNSITQNLSDTYYRPQVYVGFAQPLLYNAFGLLDRFPKYNAEIKLKTERLRQETYRLSVLTWYQKTYFDWYLYTETTRWLSEITANARQMVTNLEYRRQSGLSDADDVSRTRQALLSYLDQLNGNLLTLDGIRATLSPYVNTSASKPAEADFLEQVRLATEFNYAGKPFEETKRFRIFYLSLHRLKKTIEVSENKMLPQLNLSVKAAMKNQDREAAPAFSNLFSTIDNLDAQVGLVFSMPLGQIEGKGDLREAKLLYRKTLSDLEIEKRNHDVAMNSIRSSSARLRESISYREKNIDELKNRLTAEYQKYTMGRIGITSLLETRITLALEEIQLAVQRRKMIEAYFNYRELIL